MGANHTFTQLPAQERDYLDKAQQDYVHAGELYTKTGMFGDSLRNQMIVIQGQKRVELRLLELQAGVGAQ